MEQSARKQLYQIPYVVRSRIKVTMHLLYVILILLCMAAAVFMDDPEPTINLCRILFLLLSLFFLYCWLFFGILKKASIRLDETGITVKTLHTKRIRWAEVEHAQTYEASRNVFIGLIPKNRPENAGLFSRLFKSQYALAIPLRLFAGADPERLFATITDMIQKSLSRETPEEQREQTPAAPEKGRTPSNRTALLEGFAVSVCLSILNVFAVAVSNYGGVAISFLGSLVIYLVYENSCEESPTPFSNRIALGLFSSLPVLLVPFSDLMWANQHNVALYGVWQTAVQCVKTMIRYPRQNSVYYLTAAAFFLFALLHGRYFKALRKIRCRFMKRRNGFYLERDGRYLRIYLFDYADFNGSLPKVLAEICANQCLIERDKKEIKAFYLPVDILMQLETRAPSLRRVSVEGSNYFQLNLGGGGTPVPYGYNCFLTISEEHELEMIRLERT